jgi:hypothetical protein
MLRKLFLTAVVALGLLSPLAVTAGANAREFRHEDRHEDRHVHTYRVFYRDPCRPGWTCAGTFAQRREAERCAEGYRGRGLAISIR